MSVSINAFDHVRDRPVSPALLYSALRFCSEGIALVHDNRILYANCAFAKINGFLSGSELEGLSLKELVPEALENGGYGERHFSFSRDKLMEAYSFHVADEERMVQIITVRSYPKESLRSFNLQRTLRSGESCLSFAHDFRNVLACVALYSELLMSELESCAELHNHAETINKAGTRGLRLVKELTGSSLSHQTATLSWNQAVLEIVDILIPLLSPNTKIATGLSRSVGLVRLGVRDAYHIILSLMLDAYRAMPAGGTIRVSTRNYPEIPASVKNFPRSVPQVEFAVTNTRSKKNSKNLAGIVHPLPWKHTDAVLIAVRDIVKQSGGVIAVRKVSTGTRVKILMPRIEFSGP